MINIENGFVFWRPTKNDTLARTYTYKDYIDVKYFVLTLKNNQFFNYMLNKYSFLIVDLVNP